MVVIIDREAIEEYKFELSELKREDDLLENEEKEIKARRNEIKTRVRSIIDVQDYPKDRVILPAGEYGGWDRIVSMKGAGLNVEKLEKILGTEKFRELCCVKQTHYIPVAEKIEAARINGDITEKILNKAHVEGKLSYMLKKHTLESISRVMEKEGVL